MSDLRKTTCIPFISKNRGMHQIWLNAVLGFIQFGGTFVN